MCVCVCVCVDVIREPRTLVRFRTISFEIIKLNMIFFLVCGIWLALAQLLIMTVGRNEWTHEDSKNTRN